MLIKVPLRTRARAGPADSPAIQHLLPFPLFVHAIIVPSCCKTWLCDE